MRAAALIADYRGLGSVVSLPSGVRGAAPAENGVWCILSLKELLIDLTTNFVFVKLKLRVKSNVVHSHS